MAHSIILILFLILPGAKSNAAPDITVYCDDDYPPFAFRSPEGVLQGIVVDQWDLFMQKTGLEVELKGMDWLEALNGFNTDHNAVLETVFKTEERLELYDFLPSYHDMESSVYIHKSISGVSSLDDLQGFRVAVKAGDGVIGVLRKHYLWDLLHYPDYESIVNSAYENNIRVFCMDNLPAQYYLYKYRLESEFRKAVDFDMGPLHRAVHKDRDLMFGGKDLYDTLYVGFLLISPEEYKAIEERWFGRELHASVDWTLVLFASSIAAALILLLIFFMMLLRIQVARKTRDLLQKTKALETSERKNSAFIAALPDLFFITDIEGRYIEFVSSNPDILFEPAEEQIGRRIRDTEMDPYVADLYMSAIEKLQKGSELELIEYKLAVQSGVRFYEVRAVKLEAKRVLFIVQDVTEKKQVEQALEESLKEKEILLREIHHRVKNNMQVISSLIQLQGNSIASDHERAMLEETQQRIRSMAQVHELLYRSHKLSSLNAADYIQRLYEEVSTSYYHESQFLDMRLELEPLELHLDAAVPLGLIVNELLSNCMKYAVQPPERVQAHIKLKNTADGRRSLLMQDTGPGFPADFEERSSGSLGLTLVRSLADQLHGTISFENSGGAKVLLLF